MVIPFALIPKFQQAKNGIGVQISKDLGVWSCCIKCQSQENAGVFREAIQQQMTQVLALARLMKNPAIKSPELTRQASLLVTRWGSISALARMAGVDRITMWRWLKDGRDISATAVERILADDLAWQNEVWHSPHDFRATLWTIKDQLELDFKDSVRAAGLRLASVNRYIAGKQDMLASNVERLFAQLGMERREWTAGSGVQ